MKKIFAVFLAIFAMAYFSIPAFAGCTGYTYNNLALTSDNSTSVGLSQGVEAKYCSDNRTFTAATYNDKGNGITYGAGSEYSKVYYNNGNTQPATVDATTDFESGSWKAVGSE